MGVTAAFAVLHVTQLDPAMAFYTGPLWLIMDWREGDRTAAVGANGHTLFLKAADPSFGPGEAILNVDDADAVHAACVAAGASVEGPPETRPWGMREFRVHDPSGNLLNIGHVDESAADYSTFEGPALDA
ncbi:MAG: VOC family protein [Pseudomonadota bacterium]